MRNLLRFSVVALLAVGTAACGDEPTPPQRGAPAEAQASNESQNAALEAQINRLLNSLLPAGRQRADVNRTFSEIKDAKEAGDLEASRDAMFDLVDRVLTATRADELEDPRGSQSAAEGAVELVKLLFEFVGLEEPPITVDALEASGGVTVVQPGEETTVATGDGKAAVDVPADAFEEPALITIEKRDNPEEAGEGPLPLTLDGDRFPPLYEIETTTQPDGDLAVGTCVPTSGPRAPPSDEQDDLQIVKTVDESGQVEFLPRSSAGFLNCGGAELALAGETDSFSKVSSGVQKNPEQVVAGLAHSCALRSDGRAFCWGTDRFGQLGNGLPKDSSLTPVAVVQNGIGINGGDIRFVAIAAGYRSTCGRTNSGQVYCWGNNFWGQLGDGSTTDRPKPVPVSQGTEEFVSVRPGLGLTCARTSAGQAFCWGRGNSGQIGDGDTDDHTTPKAVDQTGISESFDQDVDAGFAVGCGLAGSGQAYCWGADFEGVLGDGAPIGSGPELTPVEVADGGVSFDQLAVGTFASCALDGAAGQAYCWGLNFRGLLGSDPQCVDPNCGWEPAPVTVKQPTGVSFEQIGIPTHQHNCGLTPGGTAYCWSLNGDGQLGIGVTSSQEPVPANPVDQSVDGGVTFTQLGVGGFHTCALTSGRKVYCWGANSDGQVGDGTTRNRTRPEIVSN